MDMLQEILSRRGMTSDDFYKEHYVIVSKSCLLELLLSSCHVPGCLNNVSVTSEVLVGACYKVVIKCEVGHVRLWSSSKTVTDAKQTNFSEINLMLSAAILLSGNHFSKIERLFEMFSIPMFSKITYTDLCNLYIYHVIANWVKSMQSVLFEHIGESDVAIAGDGRADSPGFCAQYCLYSFVYDKYVLHAELIDKRETKLKSTNMAKEGCIRGLVYLSNHINISHFCTDAHPQIKWLLSNDPRFSNIIHQFDIFHESVKLNAKLLELANKRGNSALLNWVPNIRNISAKIFGTVLKLVMVMWISLLKHGYLYYVM
jgi:hypothetical protein